MYQSVRRQKGGDSKVIYCRSTSGQLPVGIEDISKRLGRVLRKIIEWKRQRRATRRDAKCIMKLEEVRKIICLLKIITHRDNSRNIKSCSKSLGMECTWNYKKVWAKETVPSTWKEALILPIHKKGDNRRNSLVGHDV